MANESFLSRVVGLTGGIGCGKSTAAAILASRGGVVLDADRLGHDVLDTETFRRRALARWGESVFESPSENGGDVPPNRQINRRALGKIVFAPTEAGGRELEYLEHLTHPEIAQAMMREIVRLKKEKVPLIVVDAPLLYEAGWEKFCDTVIFLDGAESLRDARLVSRGWSSGERVRRESHQLSVEEKRRRADICILNDSTPEKLSEHLGRALNLL